MQEREHVLEIGDPAEGSEAMQCHVRLLLQGVRDYRSNRRPEDDVYVWWGHADAGTRPPYLDRVLQLPVEAARNDPGLETHLYLTDLSSLYVAHLGGVAADNVPARRDAHVPGWYRRRKVDCLLWYRLWDIRRLVDSDSAATAKELRRLHNVSDGGRSVGLGTGVPSTPLVVSETTEARYFDPATRTRFIEDQFWVEFDAERRGVGAVERDLRDNHFGEFAWSSYGPLARSFIATGEKLWRDHSADPAFDISTVLLELCKAVEVRCNAILRELAPSTPDPLVWINVNGKAVRVDEHYLDLDELKRHLGGSKAMHDFFTARLHHGAWFGGHLPEMLRQLVEERNAAAHGRAVTWETVDYWRSQLLGIGCLGCLVQLGQVCLRKTQGTH